MTCIVLSLKACYLLSKFFWTAMRNVWVLFLKRHFWRFQDFSSDSVLPQKFKLITVERSISTEINYNTRARHHHCTQQPHRMKMMKYLLNILLLITQFSNGVNASTQTVSVNNLSCSSDYSMAVKSLSSSSFTIGGESSISGTSKNAHRVPFVSTLLIKITSSFVCK